MAISGLETDLTADPQISNDGYADVGLDVKYGITENLTADFTLNTDFAQVEVDEQQVNLTRFNLFFPEKREFFLEGRGIFEFGNGGRGPGGNGGGGPPGSSSISSSGRGRGARSISAPTLFYSRRIGLQSGAPVSILGGGRVTGKVGSFQVGAVGIRTDDEPAVGAEATTFSVLRVRRDILARSSVGVLFEDRSNSSLASGGSNQAYGVDANFVFLENLRIFGYYAKTRTDGLADKEESYRARIGYRGEVWSAAADHVLVGENFNPELGFVRRSDFRETNLFRAVRPPSRIRLLDPSAQLRWSPRPHRKRAARILGEPASRGPLRDRVREQRLADRELHGPLREIDRRYERLRRDNAGRPVLLPATWS